MNDSNYFYSNDAGVTWNEKDTDGALTIDASADYVIDLDSDHSTTNMQLHVV